MEGLRVAVARVAAAMAEGLGARMVVREASLADKVVEQGTATGWARAPLAGAGMVAMGKAVVPAAARGVGVRAAMRVVATAAGGVRAAAMAPAEREAAHCR